ncbi:hypothetical protein ONZ45_g5086 [Pleurotus djamor]|nr:hypothetical protein ONZ45_g5086 [Pleurotus djamor]
MGRDRPVHAHLLPEILFQVLAHFSASENASHALVCKAWADVASSLAWKRIPFHAILRLLPQKATDEVKKNTGDPDFEAKLLVPINRRRFDWYRSMVQHLDIHDRDPVNGYYSLVLGVMRTIEPSEIFPGLRCLDIAANANAPHKIIRCLSHKNLKALHLTISRPLGQELFYILPSQAPRLEVLRLRWKGTLMDMALERDAPSLESASETALIWAINHLPDLRIFAAPPAWLTCKMVSALSGRSRLELFQCSGPRVRPETVFNLPQQFAPGSFGSLQELDVVMPFLVAATWLTSFQNTSPLKIFKLKTNFHRESFSSLRQFVEALRSCPRLEVLHIDLSMMSHTFGASFLIPWSSLTNVLNNMSVLTDLSIVHPNILRLNNEKLYLLCKALPRLQNLRLYVPDGSDQNTSDLGLNSLLGISPLVPDLRTLTLYLNLSMVVLPPVTSTDKFYHLEDVAFGFRSNPSFTLNAGPLLDFLDDLFPDNCIIDTTDPSQSWRPYIIDLRIERRSAQGGKVADLIASRKTVDYDSEEELWRSF